VEEVAVLVAALLGRRGEGRSLLGQPAVNDVTQDLENFAQLAGHPATTSLEVERPVLTKINQSHTNLHGGYA
jgi:hypothetical protein